MTTTQDASTTVAFDQQGINEMTVAIQREMSPRCSNGDRSGDTMFLGCAPLDDPDRKSLAAFGQDKNWKLILPNLDPRDPAAGPIGFDVVVTDGIAETVILTGGRLWKRDRRSPSVLTFPGGIVIALSAKGRMLVRGTKRPCAEEGHMLASKALALQAARKPGKAPVVTTVGITTVVVDIEAMLELLRGRA